MLDAMVQPAEVQEEVVAPETEANHHTHMAVAGLTSIHLFYTRRRWKAAT